MKNNKITGSRKTTLIAFMALLVDSAICAAAPALEEITVTARRKAESLQETPVAITALDTEDLQQLGITNLSNLNDSTPGLTLMNGSGAGSAAVPFIRGVGQKENKATLDPAVSIYLDDVYIGRPDGGLMDIIDIESIQVLRGPQGTLFGRNATGGALVLSTNKPEEAFSGTFLGRAGNYDRADGQLTLNIPLSDTVLSRWSFSTVNRDGYTTNLTTGNEHDLEKRRQIYGRFRLLPHENHTIDLNINWSTQDERGRGQSCLVNENTPLKDFTVLVRAISGTPETSNKDALISSFLASGGILDENVVQVLARDPQPFGIPYLDECMSERELFNRRQFKSSFDGRYKVDTSGISGIWQWDLGDAAFLNDAHFKSVTAWRSVDVIEAGDIDGSNVVIGDRDMWHPRETTQITQEFQMTGSLLNEKLDLSAGLFYWQEKTENGIENVKIGTPFSFQAVGANSAYGIEFGPAQTDIILAADDLAARKTNNKSWAAYSQWTYHISDQLQLTAGLRYTRETRELEAIRLQNSLSRFYGSETMIEGVMGSHQVAGLPFFLVTSMNGLDAIDINDLYLDTRELLEGGYGVPQQGKSSFDKWTPMINATYHLDDQLLTALGLDSAMIYASYSEGFRAGGIVSGRTLWGIPPQNSPGHEAYYSSIENFEPEEVNSYEAGLKMDFWEQRGRLNIAAFWMDYTNQQVTEPRKNVDNALIPDVVIANIGESEISGVELELTALLTEHLEAQFNATYTHAKFTQYDTVGYTNCDSPGENMAINGYGEVYCGMGGVFEHALDRSDEDMVAVPPWTAFIALQYHLFTPIGLVTPRIEASYSDGMTAHFDNLSWDLGYWEVPETTLYNARITIDFRNEQTRLAFYGKNLTNELSINGGIPNPESFGGGGVTFSPPRMYGIELIHNF